jgi:3'(2'), 5'-bisphosphate nucleotidase
MSLLSQILANSVCLADKSAQIARDIMASGELGIVEKTGIDDLQTKADRSVQACIVKSLRKNFPGLTVIGEEKEEEVAEDSPADWLISNQDAEAAKMAIPDEYKNAKIEQFTIWVDPLDGTKEYTEGFLDHVTVLIGIAVDKRAVAGVINQPFFNYKDKSAEMGRTLYGVVGTGVRGIDRIPPPAGQRIVTTTRSHGTGLINDTADACKPTEIIRVGGAGHKVCIIYINIRPAPFARAEVKF